MSRLSGLFGLACLVGLTACGRSSAPPAPPPAPAEAPAASAGPTPEQIAAALAGLPAPYNTGDVDNGHAKFALCMACHTVAAGAPNMTGPNLHGIFGRKAGTAPGFSYSDALKSSGWTWDAERLNDWLSGPAKVLPGTKMTFAGLPNPKDRIDVIAYLKVASSN
jgi:cytochrome c